MDPIRIAKAMALAKEMGIRVSVAAEKVAADISVDELRADDLDRLKKAIRKQARAEALANDAKAQLSLFEDVQFQLPALIRVSEEGEEDFIPRDLATLDQATDALDWRYRTLQSHLRHAEADATQWQRDLDALEARGVPVDVTVGEARWWNAKCAICGGGYRPEDPFQWDHINPVKHGGGPLQLIHRSENLSKGARLGYETNEAEDDE